MFKNQIKELAEKCSAAVARAKAIKDQFAGQVEWPTDKYAEFDKWMKEFGDSKIELQKFQYRQVQHEAVESANEEFNRPSSTAVQHKGGGSTNPSQEQADAKVYYNAFHKWLRKRDNQMTPQEQHALMIKDDALGGYTVPEDFHAEVIKDLAGFAVIRSRARVVPTNRSHLVFPSIQAATTDADIYATGYTGSWKAEAYVTGGTAPTVQNQPRFGQERIPVHSWAPDAIEITTELLEDSAANLDTVLAQIIAETKALDEDSAFLNGTGVNQPLGILNSGLSTVNSGSAAALTYPGLLDLYATLPSQYRQNAVWIMASMTYADILSLADSQNMPIFTPNQMPGTLWGKPILFSEFMPAVGAGNEPIIFGDLNYYIIAERRELRVQRLLDRFAPNIGILPSARLGGQAVRTAAFKAQTCSV